MVNSDQKSRRFNEKDTSNFLPNKVKLQELTISYELLQESEPRTDPCNVRVVNFCMRLPLNVSTDE